MPLDRRVGTISRAIYFVSNFRIWSPRAWERCLRSSLPSCVFSSKPIRFFSLDVSLSPDKYEAPDEVDAAVDRGDPGISLSHKETMLSRMSSVSLLVCKILKWFIFSNIN